MTPFVAVQRLIRRFYEETGEIPTAIELPKKLFMTLWSDVRNIAVMEHRPGFFTEGGPPVDAGNPAIEMHAGNGIVRIRCAKPVYQRELISTPAKENE